MKAYLIQMLKEIALLGALRDKIEISSIELANQIDTSQQTASRYLLELERRANLLYQYRPIYNEEG